MVLDGDTISLSHSGKEKRRQDEESKPEKIQRKREINKAQSLGDDTTSHATIRKCNTATVYNIHRPLGSTLKWIYFSILKTLLLFSFVVQYLEGFDTTGREQVFQALVSCFSYFVHIRVPLGISEKRMFGGRWYADVTLTTWPR